MTTKSETKTAIRADLHCHSTASAVAKLGVQRALEGEATRRPRAGSTAAAA
jgi:hypothetical protein